MMQARLAPLNAGLSMAQLAAQLVPTLCLAGVGHLANVALPTAFNAAVQQFLQTHFSA